MESAYSFIKTTLLGLILGVLIVLLLQVNYLADTIKNSSMQPAEDQKKEYKQGIIEEHEANPPVYRVPNTPKQKI